MKKNVIAFLAATTIILASCNKTKVPTPVEPEPTFMASEKQHDEFSTTLRLYDNTEKYFVDLEIISNRQELLNTAKENISDLKIELIEELQPSTPKKNYSEELSEPNSKKIDKLEIRVVNVEKGEYRGFKIPISLFKETKSDVTTKSSTMYSGQYNLTVQLGWCSMYQVRNYTMGGPGATCNFFDYSGPNYPPFTLIETESLNYYEYYIFAPGYNSYRKVEARHLFGSTFLLFDVEVIV